MDKNRNTEKVILEAAKSVFIEKGLEGARMQEIADKAQINKALLHYYFRTKDKLFENVFSMAFNDVFVVIEQTLAVETDFESFLERFITSYTGLLKKKPFIAQFVLHELNRKPERIVANIQQNNVDKEKIFGIIKKAEDSKIIRPVSPVHLITNILALCIFPFVARPVITGFLMDGDKKKYDQYINERPEQIISFVKNALFINNSDRS